MYKLTKDEQLLNDETMKELTGETDDEYSKRVENMNEYTFYATNGFRIDAKGKTPLKAFVVARD